MKLIRLQTEDNEGIFSTNFDSDITIKPNSQVALQSATFKEVPEELTIHGGNDEVSFQIKAGEVKKINIANNTYNSSNEADLRKDIQDKLNASLDLDGKQIGLQFKVDTTNDLDKPDCRINFSYRVSKLFNNIQLLEEGNAIDNDLTITGTTPATSTISNNSPRNVNDNARFVVTSPFGKGCSIWRVRIKKLTDNGSGLEDNGFTLGLTETTPADLSSPTMSQAQKTYFIKTIRFGEDYKFKTKTQAVQDSGTEPENVAGGTNADTIELALVGGKIVGKVYQQTGTTTLFSEDYVAGTNLYPFITFQGATDTTQVQNVRATLDPYFTPHPPVGHDENLLGDGLTATPPQPPKNGAGVESVNILTLTEDVRSFFGYKNRIITIRAGLNCDIVAFQMYSQQVTTNSYIIELRNFNLESYDSQTGTRRNIVAVLPTTDLHQLVEYEPNTPLFIDMNNKETKNIKHILARILRTDSSTPNLAGISQITLLIQ